MDMVNKFFYVLSIIAFIGVAILFILVGYWMFFPRNIIAYPKGTTWKVLNSPVKAGSYMHYELYYCKYTQDISTVYQTLAGKNIYTLAQIQRNIPVGCRSYTISDVYVPPTVPPGMYKLYITIEYHPNPIRTVQYFAQTTEFEVVK